MPSKSAKKAKPKSKPKATAKSAPRAASKATPKVAPKVASKPMPKKELHYFEKRLLEERRRVLKELGHHDEIFNTSQQASDGDLSAYSFHMADQGTDAMEREKAFLFASQEGRFLWHIDQALRRLYKSPETFGKCHNCGNDIAHERLDALPHARYCIECKQREEDAKK
jgi:DnaK suppressor protein